MDQKKKLTFSVIFNFILLLTLIFFYFSTEPVSLKAKPENESKAIASHVNSLADIKSNKINKSDQNIMSSHLSTELFPKKNKTVITNKKQKDPRNQKMVELKKEFDKKHEKAYGYFTKIRDFSEAFESDEYRSDWSNKMVNEITDIVLFDAENGINRFPAIAIDDLECRGTLCKIDFQNKSGNLADWDYQRRTLRENLMRLGGSNNQANRAIKTVWLENGKMRYYISKGVSESEQPSN